METPPRPPKLTEPPASLEPEPRTLHPLIFMDRENTGDDMLDLSPKYSDPKAPPPAAQPEEDSGEVPKEEDSTEIESLFEEKEVGPDIREMISREKSKKDEILKLVTNS